MRESDSKALLRVTGISLDAKNRPVYINRQDIRLSRARDHIVTSEQTFEALVAHLAGKYQVHVAWGPDGRSPVTQFFMSVLNINLNTEELRTIFDQFFEIETVTVIAIEILPQHMGSVIIG